MSIKVNQMDFPGFSKMCMWKPDENDVLSVKIELPDEYTLELINAAIWKEVKPADSKALPNWGLPVKVLLLVNHPKAAPKVKQREQRSYKKVESGLGHLPILTSCLEVSIRPGQMNFPAFSKMCTWKPDENEKLLVKLELPNEYSLEVFDATIWKEVKSADSTGLPKWGLALIIIGIVVVVVAVAATGICCYIKKCKKEGAPLQPRIISSKTRKDDEESKGKNQRKRKTSGESASSGKSSKSSTKSQTKRAKKFKRMSGNVQNADSSETDVSMRNFKLNPQPGPSGKKMEEKQQKNGEKTPLLASNGEMMKDKPFNIGKSAIVGEKLPKGSVDGKPKEREVKNREAELNVDKTQIESPSLCKTQEDSVPKTKA
uniref:Uncharacterized protein n=1 Tax=Panagrolaimus sp. JU765 TaxID=591449 RepID=A0AC34QJ61_9BILA